MSSGATRASSRANGQSDTRSRANTPHGGPMKGEKIETRKAASPQLPSEFGNSFHKRSASGRPLGRPTGDERHHEERKVTERLFETRLERTTSRQLSPERQNPKKNGVSERNPEPLRQNPGQGRSKEKRSQSEGLQGEPILIFAAQYAACTC